MLGWWKPAWEPVFDIEFVEEETGCCRADFGDRIDLLTDQGLRQRGRECGLVLRAVRSLRSIDADNRHRLLLHCDVCVRPSRPLVVVGCPTGLGPRNHPQSDDVSQAAFWPRPGLNLPIPTEDRGRGVQKSTQANRLIHQTESRSPGVPICRYVRNDSVYTAPRVVVGLLSGKLEFST